jgi:hypothetical protein
VSLAGGTITYTPAAGFVGADQFTYAIADPFGATATSTNQVTVGLGKATSAFTYVSLPVGGIENLRAYGIPTKIYDVLRSGDLVNWTTISGSTGVTAAANALILFTDHNANTSPLYYRFAVN